MSSPTFLGERPRGPILGARAEEAPTSPPVARNVLREIEVNQVHSLRFALRVSFPSGSLHFLDLAGIKFRS